MPSLRAANIMRPAWMYDPQDNAGITVLPGDKVKWGKLYRPANRFAPIRSKHDDHMDASFLRPGVLEMLTPYQKEGLYQSIGEPGYHLHYAPGAGKTLSGIIWALARSKRVLYLTRAAARGTIEKEVERWTTAQAYVLTGRKPAEVWDEYDIDMASKCDIARVYITAYETLPAWVDTLRRLKFEAVVFDESHRVKSTKQTIPVWSDELQRIVRMDADNQASACLKLAAEIPRRLCTTATPLRDRPRDFWAQLNLAHPGQWGSFHDFAARYCGVRVTPYGFWDTKGASNTDELFSRVDNVRHVVSREVTHAQLPAKRRRVTRLGLDDLGVGRATSKRDLKQYGPAREMWAQLLHAASKKRSYVVDAVLEALDAGLKVVVFTGLRKDCDEIAARVRAGTEAQVWAAHGGTTASARDDIRTAYMLHAGPCALIGTGDAWGESVSLHDTDLALFCMLPFTPGQLDQWEGRFTRLGQKRPVLIDYLVAKGTFDERVAGLLLEKLPAFEGVGTGGLSGLTDTLASLPSDEEMLATLTKLAAENVYDEVED